MIGEYTRKLIVKEEEKEMNDKNKKTSNPLRVKRVTIDRKAKEEAYLMLGMTKVVVNGKVYWE
jgi:hypothetical protein